MTDAPHLDDVLPIVKLVREVVDGSGMSLRVFAADRRIAYSTLRRYYDRKLPALSQPPRKETLRELALALEVTLGDVEQAALESLSYRAAPGRLESATSEANGPDPFTLPPQAAQLSPRQRAAVLSVIDAMLETSHDRPAKTEADDTPSAALTPAEAEAQAEKVAREAALGRLRAGRRTRTERTPPKRQ